MHPHASQHTDTHIHVNTNTHAHKYTHAHTHAHIHIHIHKFTHTQIHTYTLTVLCSGLILRGDFSWMDSKNIWRINFEEYSYLNIFAEDQLVIVTII